MKDKINVEKIAKKICAGGGAGINFFINDTEGKINCIIKGTPGNWNIIKKESSFKITSFNAEGYDDGMKDVDGEKIFKQIFVDNIFDDAKEYIDEIIEYFSDDEQFLEELQNGLKLNFDAVDFNNSIVFGGWVRSKLVQGSEIQFNQTFEIWSDNWSFDGLIFDSSIIATISKIGESWYQDVFEWYPQEDDIDDDFLYEIHNEDLELLYKKR